MHLHLLDIPKPRRSHLMPNTPWVILVGFCIGMSSFWTHSASKEFACNRQPASPYVSVFFKTAPVPVRWVTVTTSEWVRDCVTSQTCGIVSYHCGTRLQKTTHLEPLMELYDELCEIEDEVETLIEMPSCMKSTPAAEELLFLRAEKKFMKKYGLTLAQVKMIKREGYRMKHETQE